METETCCEHEMEFVGGGEYYLWQDDILLTEFREKYECQFCGIVETFVEDEEVS